MDRKPNPGLQRLGVEIRKARKLAKLTQVQVGKAMQVVPSTVSAWECGTRGLQEEGAQELDRIFGTSGVLQRAWNTANAPTAIPEWYAEVEHLEGMMTELREYQGQVIPGLVQTEGYIRALSHDAAPWVSASDAVAMAKSRLQRQEVLKKESPPLIYMVLEATAVTRVIGDRLVLADQLDRVLSLIDARVINVQVVPFNPGCHPGAAGPFRVYTFADKPMVASAEYQGGEVLMDHIVKVQHCVTTFGVLQSEAMSPRQSAEFIRKVKEELDDDEA